jgi:hypothetical protein
MFFFFSVRCDAYVTASSGSTLCLPFVHHLSSPCKHDLQKALLKMKHLPVKCLPPTKCLPVTKGLGLGVKTSTRHGPPMRKHSSSTSLLTGRAKAAPTARSRTPPSQRWQQCLDLFLRQVHQRICSHASQSGVEYVFLLYMFSLYPDLHDQLKKSYNTVSILKSKSGFTWSDEHGMGVTEEMQLEWDELVKVHETCLVSQ